MTWTDERTERLVELWRDGYSATVIACKLGGCTPNACLGKLQRMGELNNPSRPHAKPGPKSRLRPKKLSKPVAVVSLANQLASMPMSDPAPLMLTCLELTHRTCKWPFGDPKQPGFGFCGHATAAGSPYCEGHRQQSFSPEFRHRRAA